MNLSQIQNFINSKKECNKEFFLDMLDEEKQMTYESDRLQAVLIMLKLKYINKNKEKIKAIKQEIEQIQSDENYDSKSYSAIVKLKEEIAGYKNEINSFKCFFDEPYFARMDLVDSIEGYNSYYIGKKGDINLNIIDWRAPVAKKYYQKSQLYFSINEYNYKLILRRAIRVKSGKIIDFKNEYLTLNDYLSKEEIAGRDEQVIFDPYLKEILRTRKDKEAITDIIETIQEKQYEIITLPEKENFVLQGCAGSGKTMILLHRLSYLMYNDDKLLPHNVLIITPSDSFNAFIDELATILELQKVKTSTINDYFDAMLESVGIDLKSKVDNSIVVPEEYLRYIYSDKFVIDIDKKLNRTYKSVHSLFSSIECEEIIGEILRAVKEQKNNYEYIKNTSQRVRRAVLGEVKEKPEGGLYYTKLFRELMNNALEIEEFLSLDMNGENMQKYSYFYKQIFSFRKAGHFIAKNYERICSRAVEDLENLYDAIEKEIKDLYRYKIIRGNEETLTYADRIEKREEIKKEIEKTISKVKEISDGFVYFSDFYEIVSGERNFSTIGKCENVLELARFFFKDIVRKNKEKYGCQVRGITKYDSYTLCYILSCLDVKMLPKYSYVFVDEGQDISANEYKILKQVNENASFNIFGDLQQNITPFRGIKNWNECIEGEVYSLNQNYRNTNQIVEYVSKYLNVEMQSIGFDGDAVVQISPREVSSFLKGKAGLKAVIVPESKMEKYMRKSYNVVGQTGKISKSKINIMTVYESKGLEFSCVAVAAAEMSDNEKYISFTRALKELAIIKE